MAKRRSPRGPRRPATGADIEWVGGIVSMPMYVSGEGEPYRPEALIWMGSEGVVLGHTMGKPGELLGMACERLQSAIERPMFGRPHEPARVRVASPELASVLRGGHPSIDFVCGPTPEVDELLAMMREKMGEDEEMEPSYLSPEIGPDAVASFFRAAATLFRAKPWTALPGEQSLFSVTIEELGVRDVAMSIMGHMGQSLGLLLFSGLDDFDAFLDAADAADRGEVPELPPHFALSFERGAELEPALRKEIAEHRWEVAAANAYPWLSAVDSDLVARPATAKEIALAEAIALALSEVVADEERLRDSWKAGETASVTRTVHTHAGEMEVTLRTPYEEARPASRPPYDVIADLFELAQSDEGIDPEEREALEAELLDGFVASPEAAARSGVDWCQLVMDLAANHLGATIATLGPSDLREIVFEIIPRKVSVEASAAPAIIEENRAFFTFLKREHELERADGCLRVLGGNAVKKLEAALSNPSNFGMAKSLFMTGRDAGFDMDTKEGLEEWMRAAQSMPLPASVGLPPLGPRLRVDRSAPRAKKNKRKSMRKARKKNR